MKRTRKPRAPLHPAEHAIALRKKLKAGPRDVIDHLLVDAPPCDPDADRAVETLPRSEAANALALAMKHLPGDILLDWGDEIVAAIVELGGEVYLDPGGPGVAHMRADIRDPSVDYYRKTRVSCAKYDVPYVESREIAERQAKHYTVQYAGWNEPAPPELTAEQAAAIAAEAKFQAAEAAMVAAGERELAAEAAAKAFPATKVAA